MEVQICTVEGYSGYDANIFDDKIKSENSLFSSLQNSSHIRLNIQNLMIKPSVNIFINWLITRYFVSHILLIVNY
jgi:hypothetical protein